MAGRWQAVKADLKAKRRLRGWVLPKPESAVRRRVARNQLQHHREGGLWLIAHGSLRSLRPTRTGATMVREACGLERASAAR